MNWPFFSPVYLLKCLHRAHFYLFFIFLLNLLLRKDLFMSQSALPYSMRYLTLGLATPGSAPHTIFWRDAALRKAGNHGPMRTAVVAEREDYQTCSLNSCQSPPRPRENLSWRAANFSCLAPKTTLLSCLPASRYHRYPTIQQARLQAAGLVI